MNKLTFDLIIIILVLLMATSLYGAVTYDQAKFYEGEYVYVTCTGNKIYIGRLVQVYKTNQCNVVLSVDTKTHIFFIDGELVEEIKTLREVFKIK